jgi:hypothetical protein
MGMDYTSVLITFTGGWWGGGYYRKGYYYDDVAKHIINITAPDNKKCIPNIVNDNDAQKKSKEVARNFYSLIVHEICHLSNSLDRMEFISGIPWANRPQEQRAMFAEKLFPYDTQILEDLTLWIYHNRMKAKNQYQRMEVLA